MTDLECPDCGGPMVSRKNRSNGQRFWGCAAFPECKGTRDTDGESPSDRQLTRTAGDLPSDRARRNDRARWRA